MFNEIDGDFDDVAIRTFKVGLPTEHGLRKSLTRKPVTNVCQLMDQIDKYKRVKEDQEQGKGNGKVISQERRDFKSDRYNNNRHRRDFSGSLRLQFLKWLTPCSENWCIKFWRRPRTSHTSNGRTR